MTSGLAQSGGSLQHSNMSGVEGEAEARGVRSDCSNRMRTIVGERPNSERGNLNVDRR